VRGNPAPVRRFRDTGDAGPRRRGHRIGACGYRIGPCRWTHQWAHPGALSRRSGV
jgi:hypothetical protein